ncbi:hypothetical protein [Aquihabitans sp. McL0605]|uniref:hypothetical protein n=1 Tax=Aquihabitans sp. McL0605 TaxID=3415671 RepID=UPI003CF045A1
MAILAAGPVVWMVHLAGAAALVPVSCDRGRIGYWAINGLTLICCAAIAVAMVGAGRILRTHRPSGPTPDRVIELVCVLALLWGAISLLVTVTEGIPNLVIDACPV